MHYIGNMDFLQAGQTIRQARNQAGLTQETLARRLRMSRTTISQLETGVFSELGIRKFAQVCERLGLELQVRPPSPKLTLHEAYNRNRQERQAAFKETDGILAQMRTANKKGS